MIAPIVIGLSTVVGLIIYLRHQYLVFNAIILGSQKDQGMVEVYLAGLVFVLFQLYLYLNEIKGDITLISFESTMTLINMLSVGLLCTFSVMGQIPN